MQDLFHDIFKENNKNEALLSFYGFLTDSVLYVHIIYMYNMVIYI